MTEQITPEMLRESLIAEANTLGIKFQANISNERLQERIKMHREELAEKAEQAEPVETTTASRTAQIQKEAKKLVRVRITLLNASKRQLGGEFVTGGNSVIGRVTKFIPYDSKYYVNGYHIPQIIYNILKERKFMVPVYERKNGIENTHFEASPEFAIEVLPQLTREELAALAKEQSMAGSVE